MLTRIRPARVEEAAALSDLYFRSKAVWGHDPGSVALMPAALAVAPERIAAGDVWIVTRAAGQIAGVVALVPGDAFGASGYLRLSYATSIERIDEGLRRLDRFWTTTVELGARTVQFTPAA